MIETYRSSLKMFFGDKRHSIDMNSIRRARYVPVFDYIAQVMSVDHLAILQQEHTYQGLDIVPSTFLQQHSLYEYTGDFLITKMQKCGLAVLTADCLPIIVYDPVQHVAGIAHAGWKGSASQVVVHAIRAMQSKYNVDVSNIHAFYGANAQPCCYEVSLEFPCYFASYDYAQKSFIKRNNRLYFDNKLFTTLQLQRLGIKPENIYNKHAACTICSTQYCSARKDKELAERQVTVVTLI